MNYTNNEKLEEMIEKAVFSVENGNVEKNLTAMLKNAPTYILLAGKNHAENRYKPGNQLVTYNGIDEDGNPIQETWGGGVADIKEDSVILRNAEPIKYKASHQLEGEEVKGFYDEQGKFAVDQKNGTTTLYNEYVSDVDFVKGAYGVEANEKLQTGIKIQPSYVMKIPEDMKDVKIMTKPGVEINLFGGDYVIIDAKKDKVTSVHGCEKNWLDKTYVPLEKYLGDIKK